MVKDTRTPLRTSRYVILLMSVVIVLLITLFVQFYDEKAKSGFFADQIKYDEISYQDLITQQHYIQNLISKQDYSLCSDIESSYLFSIKNLYKLNEKLVEYLENADFVQSEYEYLRKRNLNYQIEFWLMANEIKMACNSSFEPVIYFYSFADTCANCNAQAVILNNLRLNSNEKLFIFSMDATFDGTVDLLKTKYGVTNRTTTVVINDTAYNYLTIENATQILCSVNSELNFCNN